MKAIKTYITLLLILTGSTLAAQVQFEAKVSKKTLGVNERIRVDFEMNVDGDNFSIADFAGFQVVAGPNHSISRSWVNGKRSFSKKFTYILQPTSKGNKKIKQATMQYQGETYKSIPINIVVTNAVDVPKDPNDPTNIINDNMFFVAEISNANPYLNEPISITYKLYFSKNIAVRNYDILDTPKYNDFWSNDIPIKGYPLQQGTFKGKPFYYYVFKKIVLYPQKSGSLTIKPYSINVFVDVPTNRRDIFGQRMYKKAEKSLTAGSRKINVKALPEAGKPESFTGAVGSFDFNVEVSRNSLSASESLQAKVQVKGNGNLKLFELPKLNVPSSLEAYDPERDTKVATSLRGMRGSVVDNYTLVPQYRGKYPIPALSFSYFDPKTESYRTVNSEEIVIDVIDGPMNNALASSNGNANTKQAVMLNPNQFRGFKVNANLVSIDQTDFFKSSWFYWLLLGPLLLIPIAMLVMKKKRAIDNDIQGSKIRKANKLAKKYLSTAKKNLGNQEAFYVSLEKALHNYLKAKLNIETSDFSKEKIIALLKDRNVEETAIAEFINLLKACEFARYTPSSTDAMKQDYDKAVNTLSTIDKQF
ncbi:BatD family protein [Spongiivirga sp. MCCC 1A20706]|uniref:BatD family protein n=1 Tax=Spongiivirga sp. MCCC 1A20706 TaxID=3160963 RepID=UPI0039772A9A